MFHAYPTETLRGSVYKSPVRRSRTRKKSAKDLNDSTPHRAQGSVAEFASRLCMRDRRTAVSLAETNVPPVYGLSECSRKKRTICPVASGPSGSV